MGVCLPGESDPLIVAFSGGKDSLAVMDLCVTSGRQVHGFIMAYVPGMDSTAHWIEYAKKRWTVAVREYQDPAAIKMLRRGTFRHAPMSIPAIGTKDIEQDIRERTGAQWIGYGYKRCDCIDRAVMLKTWPKGIYGPWHKFAPCHDWTHFEVLSYLSRNRIEIPDAERMQMNGVGLRADAMFSLRKYWPADYRRVLEVFPLAAAQADRHELIIEQRRKRKANGSAGIRVPGDSPVADQSCSL